MKLLINRQVCFNARLLLHGLKHLKCERIRVDLRAFSKGVIIEPSENEPNEEVQYLIMPIQYAE